MTTLIASACLLLTTLVVLIGIRGARRVFEVRPRHELARLLLGVASLLALGAISGVHTPPWLGIAATTLGLGIGLAQGARQEVRLEAGRLIARRGPIAFAVWGIGLLLMQLAGMLNLAGTFRVGQATGFLGAAMAAGTVLGRRRPLRLARGAGMAGLIWLILLIPAIGLAQESPTSYVATGPYPLPPQDAEVVSNDWRLEACGNGDFFVVGHIETQGELGHLIWDVIGEGTWDPSAGTGEVTLTGTLSDGSGSDSSTSDVTIEVVPAGIEMTDGNEVITWPLDSSQPIYCDEAAGGVSEETTTTSTAEATTTTEAVIEEEPTTTAASGVTTVPGPTDVTVVETIVVPASDDEPGFADGEVDPDEALAVAIGGFLAAVAMGALGAAESEQTLGDLIDQARGGTPEDDGQRAGDEASPDPEPATEEEVTPVPAPPMETNVDPPPEPDGHPPTVAPTPPPITWVEPPGGLQVSPDEVEGIVSRGRANGAGAEELQRYLEGLNEARGGSGTVPLTGVEAVELPDGSTVTAFTDEAAAYREAQETLQGTEQFDELFQDMYREAVTEKEKWVGLEQMPALRWAASLQELHEEVSAFDGRIAAAEQRIADIAGIESFGAKQEGDFLYSPQLKQAWDESRNDIPQLIEEIRDLQQERLQRIQQLMGTEVGGETRLPNSTTPEQTSMAHRPALKLDQLEARMERLIESRKRVKASRDAARQVVESFEARYRS